MVLLNVNRGILANHCRISHPSHTHAPSKPFNLVHSDIWGPALVPTLIGTRWFITFIDVPKISWKTSISFSHLT